MANLDSDWAYGTRTLTNPAATPTTIRRDYTHAGYTRSNTRTLTPGYGRA